MGYFIAPLLTHLDGASFELFCYDTAPGIDPVAQMFHALPLKWRDVSDLSDAMLADQIRTDELDLLLDLAGHTMGTRLQVLASRPAPVLVTWLGYPFTTGFSGFDYRIADEWTDPLNTQSINTETLALLARSQFCYRPVVNAPSAEILPADLNEGRVTFGSRNAIRKMSADLVRVWAEILRAKPDSRLLLQASGLDDHGTVGRIQGLFEAFGIGAHRLVLEGFNSSLDSIRTYDRIDIALDTFPFNGGATTCDALWMGLPVVAMAGETSFARMGVSILNAIGQSDWIAHTEDEYVDRALMLANDLPLLRRLRKTLRGRMDSGPLRDEQGFANDFGSLLLRLAKTVIN
jgi:protein O-GlcNAc transferase